MSDPLGRANFEIGATNDNLKQVVAESKREVQSLDETQTQTAQKAGKLTDDLELYFETLRFNAAKAERQTNMLGGAIGRVGQAASKAQQAVSKILIPVAVAGGIASLITRFVQLRGEADKFRKDLEAIGLEASKQLSKVQQAQAGLSSQQQTIVQINEEASAQVERIIERTRQQVEQNGSVIKSMFTGFSASDAQAEAERAIDAVFATQQQRTKLLLRQQREAEVQAEREKQEALAKTRSDSIAKSLDQINELTRQTQIDLLPPAEQIAAKLEEAIAKAREGVETAGIIDDPDIQAAVERYEAWLREKARLDTEALESRIREEQQAEIEKGQEVAKANADAFATEMQRAMRSINSSFGANFSSFGQLTTVLNKVATEIQRRRP